jgi:hypothetical protein
MQHSKGNSVNGTANYIPNEAIRISEKLKNPHPNREGATLFPKKGKVRDPFSEERVSRDQPSHEEVKNTPPDDTVKPG